jgi:hypothetical protein
LNRANMASSSVLKSLETLLEKDFIMQVEEKLHILDPLIKYSLRSLVWI